MRLGIAAPLKHSTPEEWARLHHELGCKSVNFPLDYPVDENVIDEYVEAAKKYDLVIAEVGAWGSPMARDEAVRAAGKKKCIEQLKLADRVGARCCVNVVGALGDDWAGAEIENFSEEVWQLAVKTIQEIIDGANPQNTYYAIEPMPWMIPMDPDQYVKLIEDVNREHFAVHMDIVNLITSPQKYFFNGEFLEECFEKLGDKIRSCHLKDIDLKGYTLQLKEVKCGEGILDIEKYVELATKYDVDMPMIIEHLHTEEDYRESFSYVSERLGLNSL